MSNDFIPFAVGGSANVITQSAYAALTAVTQNGFSAGIAQSNQLNKVWRQSSIMSAVLAQFIVDQSGQNAVDDGTTATLETNLIAAIRNAAKQTVILTDTGAVNAYAAANTPALTVLPGTGYTQRVNIAHANTGASTYAPDGLTAKPIYGLGLQPLQGGELPVGIVILMYLVQAGVNSGNGAWIIIESLGGASQIAPATQSQHALQLGQATGRLLRTSVYTLITGVQNVTTIVGSTVTGPTTTGAGTHTPLSNTVSVHAKATGGGAGGGGSNGTGAGACSLGVAGGGGASGEGWYAPSTRTITVGAGGAGGAAGNNAGSNGGASSYGAALSAPGGGAGSGGGTGTTPPFVTGAGAAAVSATGGNVFNATGGNPTSGVAMNASNAVSGIGGGSIYGSGGQGQAVGFAGVSGGAPGVGGSGGCTGGSGANLAGGAGQAGIVIVEEWA